MSDKDPNKAPAYTPEELKGLLLDGLRRTRGDQPGNEEIANRMAGHLNHETGYGRFIFGNNVGNIHGVGPAGSQVVVQSENVNGRQRKLASPLRLYNSKQEAVDDYIRTVQTNFGTLWNAAEFGTREQFVKALKSSNYQTGYSKRSKQLRAERNTLAQIAEASKVKAAPMQGAAAAPASTTITTSMASSTELLVSTGVNTGPEAEAAIAAASAAAPAAAPVTPVAPSAGPPPAAPAVQNTAAPRQGSASIAAPKLKLRFVSFGTLLLKVLGTAAITQDRIGDVQFVFYKMNENSGGAASLNVSEFPIDMSRLQDDYVAAVTKKGGPLGVGEFLSNVISQIHDIRSPIYGLAKYYEGYKFGEAAKRKAAWKDVTPNEEKSFTLPNVGIDIQVGEPVVGKPESGSSPIDLLQSLSTSSKIRRESMGDKSLVMRIHVYDSAYTGVPNIKSDDAPPPTQSEAIAAKEQIQQLLVEKAGTGPDGKPRVTLVDVDGKVSFSFKDASAFDDLVSSYMPSIIVGANGSTIMTISAGSKMNQLIQTAALVGNAPGQSEFGAPAITSRNGLPYVVTPAEVNITMLGCPLVRFGQTFYVNFNTSTTLDGDYYVGTLSHGFAPGKFTTTMKLAPRSGAATFMSDRNVLDRLESLKNYLALSR